jgi:hypothetical protein
LDQLDAKIQSAADQAGISYLADMKDSLAKKHLQLCDKRKGAAGVNFVDVKSVNGLATQRFNPLNWLHNSLHPNERGHAAMLETLVTWLDTNKVTQGVPPTQRTGNATRSSVPAAAVTEPEPPCSMTVAGDASCKTMAREWVFQQILGRWPWSLLVLVGLLVLWAASIALISALPEPQRS